MHTDKKIILNLSYKSFEDAVLSALEKDTGAVPIIPEILRILKIKQRKEQIAETRLANLARANAARRALKPVSR